MRLIDVETSGACGDIIIKDGVTGERISLVTKLEVVFEAGKALATGRLYVATLNPDDCREMIADEEGEEVTVFFFGGPAASKTSSSGSKV